jgi:hypothetical protein
MTTEIGARDKLEAAVSEYRHVLSEHRRAGRDGSVRRHLLVRQRPDADCDVLVDGVRLERVTATRDLAESKLPLTFAIGGQEFREIFEAPTRSRAPTSPSRPASRPGGMPPPSPPTG